MCEAVERYGDKRAENAGLDNLLNSIKKIMANSKIEAEQALNVLEVSESDRAILQKRM